MQFWLWLFSGGGAQRARDWKPVRLRDLTLRAVLGEIFWPWNPAYRLPPRSPHRRTPIKMAAWDWMAFSLSWGVGGTLGAYWLFG